MCLKEPFNEGKAATGNKHATAELKISIAVVNNTQSHPMKRISFIHKVKRSAKNIIRMNKKNKQKTRQGPPGHLAGFTKTAYSMYKEKIYTKKNCHLGFSCSK